MVTSLNREVFWVVAFLLLILFASPVLGVSFPPVDEAKQDPGLSAFRDRLLQIVKRQDVAALIPNIHPDAISSFGGKAGCKAFIETIKNEPKRWGMMKNILGKGGKFRLEINENGRQERVFYAPYTFFAEIPGSDAMAIVVLAGANIPVYSSPALDSTVIASYSDEALEVMFGNRADNRIWYQVKLPTGKIGFVFADLVATTADHRIGLVEHKGKWVLKYFIGGD